MALTVKTYNQEGVVTGEMELSPRVFGVKTNPVLVQQVIVALQAQNRKPIAHTKTRGEVRGGGKKPWKQKGTGRARHGSIRSPLWVGGGITFGPRSTRNFAKRLNKKMKTKALCMALSEKLANEHLLVFDAISLAEPKTKRAAAWLAAEPLKRKKTLIVLPDSNENVFRATRNLQNVKTVRADSLSVLDVLGYEQVVIAKASVPMLEKTYLKS